jgi:DNA primase
VNFSGRELDPFALWSLYIDRLPNVREGDYFAPLVVCPNPEHDTAKSHFQINLQEPFVHCFAHCGISGSYIHAVCVIEGLYEKFQVDLQRCGEAFDKHPRDRSPDDRAELRKRYRAHKKARKIILQAASGISRTTHVQRKRASDRRPAKAISADALQYELYLPPLALEYLDERGISAASIAKWQIGWDPEEQRIVIPARDENDHLKFLVKRAVRPQDMPKYLYTEGFPKSHLLFGVDKIELGVIKSVGMNLVEGTTDAIMMHQHGLTNTGAILGTGISDEQVKIIARINPPRIVLCFDKDTAGIRNIEIAYNKLRKYPLYVMRYPRGKSDPMELSGKEAHRQIARAVPAVDFIHMNRLNVKRRKEPRFA